MRDWGLLYAQRAERAALIKDAGSLQAAITSGTLAQYSEVTLTEALVLGLLNQGVRKYIGIFGHGSTGLGEGLRTYQQAGLVQMYRYSGRVVSLCFFQSSVCVKTSDTTDLGHLYNERHETAASHAAALLQWQDGIHYRINFLMFIVVGLMAQFPAKLIPNPW